jgi:hypothetical protein
MRPLLVARLLLFPKASIHTTPHTHTCTRPSAYTHTHTLRETCFTAYAAQMLYTCMPHTCISY